MIHKIYFSIINRMLQKNKILFLFLIMFLLVTVVVLTLVPNEYWKIIQDFEFIQNFWKLDKNKNPALATTYSFSILLLPTLVLNTFILPIIIHDLKRSILYIHIVVKRGKYWKFNISLFLLFVALNFIIFSPIFLISLLKQNVLINKIDFYSIFVGFISYLIISFFIGFILGYLFNNVVFVFAFSFVLLIINIFLSYIFLNFELFWKLNSSFLWLGYFYPLTTASTIFNMSYFSKLGILDLPDIVPINLYVSLYPISIIFSFLSIALLRLNLFYKFKITLGVSNEKFNNN